MKGLSIPTKFYLIIIYLLGLGILIWNLAHITTINFLMVGILSLLASFFLIFKVEGATNRSHYTFSFLVYGFAFVYLSLGETLLVILISNLAEWAWNRPPWFIQVFNTSCYIFVMAITYFAFTQIDPSGTFSSLQGMLSVTISMGIFTLLNHFIIGIVIWLARGEDFRVSGVFDFFPLMMDLTFLTFGAMLTMVLKVNPYALILFMFPLYLIYATLRIPALERKTELDQKTGLFNHEYFMQHLSKELDRANRFDRPLSIIMLDLDLLRNINNTYGHLAGDEVLIGIARILKQSVREYDVVARVGGEEFSIMLPETSITQSFERAELIRNAIENAEFVVPTSIAPIKITISLGLAERESFTQSASEIIHNADTALYRSKLNGRNQSFIYKNDAYMTSPRDEQKVEAASKSQGQLREESIPQGKTDYSAAKTKYVATKTNLESSNTSTEKKTSPETSGSRLRLVYLYIGGLAILAFSLFYSFYRYAPEQYQMNWAQIWPGLLTCIFFVAVTELYSIDLYLGNTSLSTSAVPLLAGTLLYGPIAGVILCAIYTVATGIKYRSKFNKYIFNFSNQMIAVMLYTMVLHLVGHPFNELSIGLQVTFVVLAAIIVYTMNTWLISIGMGIDLRQSPRLIWMEQYAWLITIYIGIGLMAAAFIVGYRGEGIIGATLMMVPLLLLRISQKQYVDHTREMVTELREKNIALEKTTKDINQLSDGLLDTLAEIIDLRDPYVLGHSKRVTNYATMIAERMGLNPKQVELIRKGSLLHDIGKLGISTDILSKRARLTNQEFEEIKRHPDIGARVLENNPSLRQLVPIVRHHHEFYNGQGYPDGLSGHQIPIEARIVSVADAIEAMSSDRPYRKARSEQFIIDEIEKHSGIQFDPKIVELAITLLKSEEISKASHEPTETIFAIRRLGHEPN
ncbi:MAG TPA: diguanylate cyclase [Anaerolineales bacterium]|nr:diguanylate cyclase [Anaerolineales bacterium]